MEKTVAQEEDSMVMKRIVSINVARHLKATVELLGRTTTRKVLKILYSESKSHIFKS